MDNREAARLMTANGVAWVLAAKHKRVDASFRSFTVPWAGEYKMGGALEGLV